MLPDFCACSRHDPIPPRRPITKDRKSGQKHKGNPKMAYVNNRVSTVPHSMTKEQWRQKRRELGAAYDAMPAEEKARWLRVFRAQGCRRRCDGQAQQTKRAARARKRGSVVLHRAAAAEQPGAFAPMWEGSLDQKMVVKQSRALPVSEIALNEFLHERYGGSLYKVQQDSGGRSEFTVHSDVKDRSAELDSLIRLVGDPFLWGCAGGWRNICPKLRTADHMAITARLSAIVDDLGRATVAEVNTVFAFVGLNSGKEVPPVIFLLLGTAVWNPKAEILHGV